MDDIKKILEKQNIYLLEQIADEKFTTNEEKTNFIDKYNKINYRNYKIIYIDNNLINNYKKIVDNIAF